MQSLDGGKKGFLFPAERDGDYEFTVQFIYPDGSTSPRVDELSPQQRIIVDTTAPQVKIFAVEQRRRVAGERRQPRPARRNAGVQVAE